MTTAVCLREQSSAARSGETRDVPSVSIPADGGAGRDWERERPAGEHTAAVVGGGPHLRCRL